MEIALTVSVVLRVARVFRTGFATLSRGGYAIGFIVPAIKSTGI